jgi:hypothetical protein
MLLISGCSRVGIAYRTSDLFIEHYADDYLDLDSSQLAEWRPTLREAVSRHREEELPYLARFFDVAYRGARDGFGPGRVLCLIDQFEDIYRRHFRIAVGLAAPLLADLSPKQIRQLESRFAEEAAEEVDESPAAVAKRERKRAERYAKAVDWWFGSLSDTQLRVIEDVTAAMPDTAGAWQAYRDGKRRQLIALLERGAREREIRVFLRDWLVEYRDLPADLRRARTAIREQIVELFLRMDRSFSAAQRDHFSDRLASLRDDFLSLQERPRMAEVACPSAP